MAKIYYEAVMDDRRTVESVPKLWRAAVQKMIDDNAKEK
ncbi:MAG: CD1375 family protein [Collinsella sp.]|jgi:hypothetical protein|nr:CD1375 family protein [Collinsella sp.]UVY22415.1 MAG: hypothetical protein [Bacteriophage sp.]UWI36994.1 MAG: hypothetical protein [Bacteriophage sp.]DAU71581.1 MAG TPA: hypothetical protein [Caudoviricetes sp.]